MSLVALELLTIKDHCSLSRVLNEVRVTQSLVFWVVFIFSVLFRPLHCMSFDFRLLIISLVSSNFSFWTLTINPINTMGATWELLTMLEHLSSFRLLMGSVLLLFIYCVCPRWLLFCFCPFLTTCLFSFIDDR